MVMISQNGAEVLRNISVRDFQTFGIGHVSYVRPTTVDNRHAYGLFAADGRLLTLHESAAVAAVTSRHNGLEPLTLQ